MDKMRHRPMDLMQVHNLIDWETHLKTLRDWKEEGRVRYTGVTHYRTGAFDELARVIRTRDIDFVQLPYSPTGGGEPPPTRSGQRRGSHRQQPVRGRGAIRSR